MTPRLMDRLARLEAIAVSRPVGKHLVFQVEATHGTQFADIVAFLKGRGHAIHDDDDVFVMNVGAHQHDACVPIRDLSRDLLTEELRAAAPAGGKWPSRTTPFTFHLESPGVRQ
ncbi:hypothetical protein ACLBX9_02990 [Methylobacterium sp. A49B]